MLVRVLIIYIILTFTAVAFHENTFAVFELKEELQIRMMNLWELFQQLEYVRDSTYAINVINRRTILRGIFLGY